jgi:hypothetical protein
VHRYELNPKIAGGANYHCHIVAKRTFTKIDNSMACAVAVHAEDTVVRIAGGYSTDISNDGVPYLAMVAVTGTPALRPQPRQKKLVNAVPPPSRAGCERRGTDGFCDPSNELGCGGMHCGRRYDGV